MTAQQLQPHAVPEPLAAQQLYQPHLTAAGHMGAAAGAPIRTGKLRDPHRAGQLLFAAIGQSGQLLRGGVPDVDGVVGPDISVGLPLHLQRLFPCDGGVVVNGDHVRAHVEAHIVTVEGAAQHTGDDMLTGVLLHVVEPPRPVDMAAHLRAYGQRLVAQVGDDAVFLVYIQHAGIAQRAEVGGLAAALGVEGGAVKGDGKAVFHGLAGRHHGGEVLRIGIFIVELDGVHQSSFSTSPTMAMCSSSSCFCSTAEGAPIITSCAFLFMGKGMISRMELSPASSITMRSTPGAMPAWGGAP